MTENRSSNNQTPETRESILEEATKAILEARYKLKYLGLGSISIEYDMMHGGYASGLPMGLGFIIDDIERQLELVENLFHQLTAKNRTENDKNCCYDVPF